MAKLFSPKELKRLYKPVSTSAKEDNGQITIIGGSSLFHGAPLLALKTASRIVDMVFFASPEPSVGRVAEKTKSSLFSFIWIPIEEIGDYIKKSDAVLIGPGFMRFRNEKDRGRAHLACDEACQESKELTEHLLKKFPKKQWVIDGGSLQTMEPRLIPRGAILTPNRREFGMLFGRIGVARDAFLGRAYPFATLKVADSPQKGHFAASLEGFPHLKEVEKMAKQYHCIIVLKGPTTIVCSPKECVVVKGGNPGLTKGGTGDVQAGLTVALAAKNDPMLAACAASYIIKKAGESLAKKVGFTYNADDLAEEIPRVLGEV